MADKTGFKRWVKKVSARTVAKLTPDAAPGAASGGGAQWHPQGRPYPRLIGFDAAASGLSEQTGIYAIWHLGVRPQWLKVGASVDLAVTLTAAVETPHIVYFQPNGGVYVAWAMVDAVRAPTAARYLSDLLRPVFHDDALPNDMPLASQAVPFSLPPGVQP